MPQIKKIDHLKEFHDLAASGDTVKAATALVNRARDILYATRVGTIDFSGALDTVLNQEGEMTPNETKAAKIARLYIEMKPAA